MFGADNADHFVVDLAGNPLHDATVVLAQGVLIRTLHAGISAEYGVELVLNRPPGVDSLGFDGLRLYPSFSQCLDLVRDHGVPLIFLISAPKSGGSSRSRRPERSLASQRESGWHNNSRSPVVVTRNAKTSSTK